MIKAGNEKGGNQASRLNNETTELATTSGASRVGLPVWQKWLIAAMVAVTAVVILILYNLLYIGKVLPGVRADGVYVGGLSRAEAIAVVNKRTTAYAGGVLNIQNGTKIWRVNLPDVDLTYDSAQAVDVALNYGRVGNPLRKAWTQVRTFFSRTTNIAVYEYDTAKLAPYLSTVWQDESGTAENAALNFSGNNVTVQPAKAGTRLDIGLLAARLQEHLAKTDATVVAAPVYSVAPSVQATDLDPLKATAAKYTTAPLNLHVGVRNITVTQPTIISWLNVSSEASSSEIRTITLPADFFHLGRGSQPVSLSLSSDKVAAYVASIASQTDSTAQDAQLTISGGKATVFHPSRSGQKLDQTAAIAAIKQAVAASADQRTLTLAVATVQPQVNENTLNDLGINELISEGVTYFPGSPSERLQNIRVGQSKFNGVLLKPGQVFSFGALLGDVGPAQGYAPGLVIIGNHEEKQYGGGLCQVSSTAYRAALLAGLPILQRTNHSFAVKYYTAPFGIPGVDATIYYPQVDMKFLNDTGHYILIQTIMQGTTLKFDFYGTKTKSGRIRGPFFVSGSLDATKPSHTVFYRDVLDLSGNVTKTDSINTYYQSSLDFPIIPQFN